jgi:hypothetical protein
MKTWHVVVLLGLALFLVCRMKGKVGTFVPVGSYAPNAPAGVPPTFTQGPL